MDASALVSRRCRNWPVIVGVAVLLVACPAFATVAWVPPSGSNSGFGYSGGLNNTGRFGNPAVTPLGFFFYNTDNFIAQGGAGISDSETDFARVTVDVAGSTPPGAPAVHSILVREWGTWSDEVSQITDFQVQADYSVFRYVPAPPGNTGSLTMPVTFFADGTWTSERRLTAGEVGNPPFSNLDWQRFQITVTDTIQVKGTAPAGSWIEKTGMKIIIPEPASLLLLVAGCVPLALRRVRG